MGHSCHHFGDMEILLGGDTSPDQARASRPVLFDKGYGQTEVMGVQGGGIPTWPAADDDYVVQL
jgi:hypothetical protein